MSRHSPQAIGVWCALTILLWVTFSMTPNPYYDYCTTTGAGVPFPHRIDYCECDGMGGVTQHKPMAFIYNLAVALLISSPIVWMMSRRKKS